METVRCSSRLWKNCSLDILRCHRSKITHVQHIMMHEFHLAASVSGTFEQSWSNNHFTIHLCSFYHDRSNCLLAHQQNPNIFFALPAHKVKYYDVILQTWRAVSVCQCSRCVFICGREQLSVWKSNTSPHTFQLRCGENLCHGNQGYDKKSTCSTLLYKRHRTKWVGNMWLMGWVLRFFFTDWCHTHKLEKQMMNSLKCFCTPRKDIFTSYQK